MTDGPPPDRRFFGRSGSHFIGDKSIPSPDTSRLVDVIHCDGYRRSQPPKPHYLIGDQSYGYEAFQKGGPFAGKMPKIVQSVPQCDLCKAANAASAK